VGGRLGVWRDVWILVGISFSVAIGFGVVSPVLPLFAVSFGANEAAAGAVISAFALMRLVFSPLVGRMDDRFGVRQVLIGGVLIVAASSALAAFSNSYAQLIVLRGVGGVGSAMFSVAGMTALLAAVGPQHRGRAAALYQGGFLLGAIAGPALGGMLARISIRAPFFFYAGTLLIAAAVALGLRRGTGSAPKTKGGATGESADPPSLRVLFHDARFRAALLANLAQGWTSHGVRSALVPLFVGAYLAQDAAQAAGWTGIAMAVAAAVQAAAVVPAGVIVDRYGRRLPMIVGSLIAAAGIAAIGFSRGIVLLTVILCAYALGSALLGSAPAAVVGDVAGPGGDRAVAVFSMCGDAGAIIGPVVAGFMARHWGYEAAFGLGAIWWLIAAAASLRMPRNAAAPPPH
jgi:MFS family permease